MSALPTAAALLAALPGAFWVVISTRAACLSSLGRDQGIFQYFAWAIGRGEVLYRDIRDVNGPLTTFVHLVFLRLGGEDEARFRALDLTVTGLVFALVGACLSGLDTRPRAAKSGPIPRAAFALAASVVLGAQYLSHSHWDMAQRETIADWFLFSSAAAQVLASQVAASRARAFGLLALSGALAATTWFGKPTFLLFAPAQLVALGLDDDLPFGKLVRLGAWASGVLAGSLVWLGLLVVYGDVGSFVRIAVFEAPVLYRYIWACTVGEIFDAICARRRGAGLARRGLRDRARRHGQGEAARARFWPSCPSAPSRASSRSARASCTITSRSARRADPRGARCSPGRRSA